MHINHIFLVPFFINIIIAYLMGCINSSILVAKVLNVKQDIRTMGSGNAGFTNTLRTVGKKAAILTFLGDFTKGILAVWISIKICFLISGTCDLMTIKLFAYSAALACVIGHIYPCFFGFKGGKGILTAWAASLLFKNSFSFFDMRSDSLSDFNFYNKLFKLFGIYSNIYLYFIYLFDRIYRYL